MLDAASATKRMPMTKIAKAKAVPAAPLFGAKLLVRRHLAAFGALAGLTVLGQGAVLTALHAPNTDAPTAALAQKQQTWCRHLVSSAQAVQLAQTPARRAFWENDLRDTADQWKISAQTLPYTGDALAKPLGIAGAAQTAMLDDAKNLLAALPPEGSRQKTDLSPYLTPLVESQASYTASMDTVAAGYQTSAAGHLTLLRELSAGFGMLTLLLLAGFGASVAKPAAISGLVALEEKNREQDAALGEADRQIAEMRRILENTSTIDALTGLQNHRAFQERLEREMGRALRYGQPLSLLLLDLDKFKSYNDSYSHTEGDQALRLIAKVIAEIARASDIPARYGGKEFVVILTETDMMGAVVLGERLRQAVASLDGLQRPLTASIGLATLNGNIFSAPALIAQADRALCHAKGDGRNRVSHAHRIPAPLEDEAPTYARAA